MRPLACALLVAGAVLGVAPQALAADPAASFALKALGGSSSDGFYVYPGQPGAVIEGVVLVVNAGNAAGTARLDAVDATTGATTGAVYKSVGDRSADVGAWLRLDRREVTLGPGDSATVGFTVSVPDDARRGEHLGGIVAAPLEETAGSDAPDGRRSFQVNVVNQSIIAVQVDLPGPARQILKVRDVEAGGNPGYQTLVLALSNPGERMVRGKGSVEIVGGDGAAVARQDFAIDTSCRAPASTTRWSCAARRCCPATTGRGSSSTGATGASRSSSRSR